MITHQNVRPAVIAVKSDCSVKVAMDAVQLDEQVIKKRAQMPNLSELLDIVSIKINNNTGKTQNLVD